MGNAFGTQKGLDLEEQSHLDPFCFCGHICFILLSVCRLGLSCLVCRTITPSLKLNHYSDSHTQTGRQDLNVPCTASWLCGVKAPYRMGHLQQRAPRTGSNERGSQNTTQREQFTYLTASVSASVSGHHGKNLGRTNVSGHSWERISLQWRFRCPVLKSFVS